MSKFRIISDLHLEFHNSLRWVSKMFENDRYNGVKYLILAGDICTLDHINKLSIFYDTIGHKYRAVYYVLGNHEFYKNKAAESVDLINTTTDKYKKYVEGTNFKILDNEVHKTDCGKMIAGCTLWANPIFENFKKSADYYAVDYEDYIKEHNNSKNFLKNNKNVDIIVTHHGPSFKLVDERYKNANNTTFYSDCSEVYKNYNGIWIYGHTHIPIDKTIGNTRFICNPYGYPLKKRIKYRDTRIIDRNFILTI